VGSDTGVQVINRSVSVAESTFRPDGRGTGPRVLVVVDTVEQT